MQSFPILQTLERILKTTTMRTIKFRGKCCHSDAWAYGNLVDYGEDECPEIQGFDVFHEGRDVWQEMTVERDTIGQFTGLYDKNGEEIYEGDIIEFYTMETYCINPDCEHHLLVYGERIIKNEKAVKFLDGMFGAEGDFDFVCLQYCCILEDDLSDELKKDPYFDSNGYDINSIIGIKVIGNIHDNPKLLENDTN